MKFWLFPLMFFLAFQTRAEQEALTEAKQVQSEIKKFKQRTLQLNSNNCLQILTEINTYFTDWMPHSNDQGFLKIHGLEILQDLFDLRMSLHKNLDSMTKECLTQMKDVFRNLRASADIVGVMAFQDQQVRSEDIHFTKQPVPVLDFTQYHPYFSLNSDPHTSFAFKKGDLIISKGVTMTSSMISSIPQQPSLFSHIVFIYQDPKTSQWGSIESYIGRGVDFYSLRDALLNENARLLVLRPKDQNMALLAHDYMFNRVQKSFLDKQKIAYDYAQDFNDNSRLTCEEIAFDAFKTASQGQMIIPSLPAEIAIKDQRFVESLGLRNGSLMVPADLEVDSRFEVVLDWTDYRLMRDSWRKDALASEIIRWINDENYIMHDSYRAMAAKMIWKTRGIPGIWSLLSKISGIPTHFETDVPAAGIEALANLETLALSLLPRLERLDQEHFKQTHQWLSRGQLREQLNRLRLEDRARYRPPITFSDFHYFFKPAL